MAPSSSHTRPLSITLSSLTSPHRAIIARLISKVQCPSAPPSTPLKDRIYRNPILRTAGHQEVSPGLLFFERAARAPAPGPWPPPTTGPTPLAPNSCCTGPRTIVKTTGSSLTSPQARPYDGGPRADALRAPGVQGAGRRAAEPLQHRLLLPRLPAAAAPVPCPSPCPPARPPSPSSLKYNYQACLPAISSRAPAPCKGGDSRSWAAPRESDNLQKLTYYFHRPSPALACLAAHCIMRIKTADTLEVLAGTPGIRAE